MTEFEQQVAEALDSALEAISRAGVPWPPTEVITTGSMLAPRVAAAIEAAFGDYEGLDARKDALAALRGEP